MDAITRAKFFRSDTRPTIGVVFRIEWTAFHVEEQFHIVFVSLFNFEQFFIIISQLGVLVWYWTELVYIMGELRTRRVQTSTYNSSHTGKNSHIQFVSFPNES